MATTIVATGETKDRLSTEDYLALVAQLDYPRGRDAVVRGGGGGGRRGAVRGLRDGASQGPSPRRGRVARFAGVAEVTGQTA